MLHGDCLAELKRLPDNSIDAVVTDPPYGLSPLRPDAVADVITRWASGERDYMPQTRGFMGRVWDGFVPPPAVWDECLRVLKPGGHVAVFAGARTVDLMGLSIRLAGFEIRDTLGWLYGSGFPKSLDVGRAVEELSAKGNRVATGDRDKDSISTELTDDERRFCDWIRDHGGLTVQQHRKLFGNDRFLTGEVIVTNTANRKLPPRWGRWAMVPTAAAWEKARPHLAVTPPKWVEDLVKNPPKPDAPFLDALHQSGPSAGQSTEGEGPWSGWGTALKPAIEPIILARKPLAQQSVASNVLEHGTGALNIDACRIGTNGRHKHSGEDVRPREHGVHGDGLTVRSYDPVDGLGRFPANVVIDEHAAVVIDKQSGTTKPRRAVLTSTPGGVYANGKGLPAHTGVYGLDDVGGASRFFYCAKASTRERPVAPDGTKHPTVKPLALMTWLLKLTTPPGGVVLDPFGGSGTTAEAALLQRIPFVTIERDPAYIPLILSRLERSTPTKKSA